MRLRPASLAAAIAMLAILNAAAQAQPASKPKADPRVQTLATDGEAVIDVAVQRGQLTHLVLPAGETFTLPADRVLRAIGQTFVAAPAGSAVRRWRW